MPWNPRGKLTIIGIKRPPAGGQRACILRLHDAASGAASPPGSEAAEGRRTGRLRRPSGAPAIPCVRRPPDREAGSLSPRRAIACGRRPPDRPPAAAGSDTRKSYCLTDQRLNVPRARARGRETRMRHSTKSAPPIKQVCSSREFWSCHCVRCAPGNRAWEQKSIKALKIRCRRWP